MCSTRVLTRRDVLKEATAVGAVACLPGTSVSFAGGKDEETRGISQSVRSRNHDQLPPATAENPIRVHIELKNANLYGFQALA